MCQNRTGNVLSLHSVHISNGIDYTDRNITLFRNFVYFSRCVKLHTVHFSLLLCVHLLSCARPYIYYVFAGTRIRIGYALICFCGSDCVCVCIAVAFDLVSLVFYFSTFFFTRFSRLSLCLCLPSSFTHFTTKHKLKHTHQ